MKYKILLLILLLALSLRIWGINEPIWVDEAISLNFANQPLIKGIQLTISDVHLPLHTIMLHFWPGTSLLSARLFSVLFGVLTVFMIYLISKELFDERTGLIASFLYSISTLAIYYSQEARVYSLLTFAVCLSMYFLIKENKKAYFFSTLFMLYLHPFAILAFISQWINKKWVNLKLILLGCYIPALYIFFIQSKDVYMYSWIPSLNFKLLLYAAYDMFSNYFLMILFIVLLFLKYKEKLTLSWLVTPIFLLILASLFNPFFHVRYVLFCLPALYIIYAKLITKLGRRRIVSVLLVIIFISAFISIKMQAETMQKPDWKTASEYVEGTVLVEPYFQQYPLMYYLDYECFSEEFISYCSYYNHNIISLKFPYNWQENETLLTTDFFQNRNTQLKDFNIDYIILENSSNYPTDVIDYLKMEMVADFNGVQVWKQQ